MLNKRYRDMLKHENVIRRVFMYGKKRAAEIGYENVFDYSLGNPSVPCPQKFTDTLYDLLDNSEPLWLHGYTPNMGDPEFCANAAKFLTEKFGLPYKPTHVYPTTGAAGALNHALRSITEPGDEVMTFAPYFSEYMPYVMGCDCELKIVPPMPPTFQPNLEEFERMMNPKVTAVLINTPCNPTGVVYSEQTLKALAEIMTRKSEEFGHPIYLVSDEPYRDIVFDGKTVPYPAHYYNNTLTCFSFSKTLSMPGERLGYVAVSPNCVDEELLVAVMGQISRFTGHNGAPSLMQHAAARCFGVVSDVSVYETNMNLLYDKLKEVGFEVERPGGSFYIFPKAFEDDAEAFCMKAREFDLLFVPSNTFGITGYVRLAYCIDTEKVIRSLPAIEKLAKAYGK